MNPIDERTVEEQLWSHRIERIVAELKKRHCGVGEASHLGDTKRTGYPKRWISMPLADGSP
jgi:hypothetical protein